MPQHEGRDAMPGRPDEHVLETLSIRRFERELGAWVSHRIGSDDYGIDLRVEIFRDGYATGEEFAVQLKGTRRTEGTPKKQVKRSTLNYWRALAIPTLIVLWDESTDKLWMKWAHQLPFDSNSDAQRPTIVIDQEWSQTTVGEIDREVRAFRAANELALHLPIDLLVTGESFYGLPAGPLKTAIFRLLQPLQELSVRFSDADVPNLLVRLSDSGIEAGIGSSMVRRLTYGNMPPDPPYSSIAADVAAALAFSLIDRGHTDFGARLVERAVGESEMLLSCGRLSEATALLAHHNRRTAVVTLVRRSHEHEESPFREEALAGFVLSGDQAGNFVKRVANVVKEAADNWAQPAVGYYNAGSLLRSVSPHKALSLYDSAASADPDYVKRGYWWRERGGVFYLLGDQNAAEECYRRGCDLGDNRAAYYLADLHRNNGSYAAALQVLGRAALEQSPADAYARLLDLAIAHIVCDWGIQTQERIPADLDAPPQADWDTQMTGVQDAIRSDALNGWAHWRRSALLAERGEANLSSLIAAATFVRDVPAIWDELVRLAIREDRMEIAFDALWCAREFCGPEFIEMLHIDPFFDDETRDGLLHLYESLPEEVADIEIRQHAPNGEMMSLSVELGSEHPDPQAEAEQAEV